MTLRLLTVSLLFCGACNNAGDRPVVVGNVSQGSYTVRTEPNPMDSMPREAPPARPTGPTTREVEQQRRIEQLEAQSKGLNAEIERLKREKTAP